MISEFDARQDGESRVNADQYEFYPVSIFHMWEPSILNHDEIFPCPSLEFKTCSNFPCLFNSIQLIFSLNVQCNLDDGFTKLMDDKD